MRSCRALVAAATSAGAVLLAGCGGLSGTNALSPTPVTIAVTSPGFTGGGTIPPRFTCQGADVSPPLRFAKVPHSASALELVMRDRDADKGHFIHWQLTAIPASTRALASGQIPHGAKSGPNSFGTVGYRGPCPPAGPAHHYLITVRATEGAALLGEGSLAGTYTRR